MATLVVQSDQKLKSRLARLWHPYFGTRILEKGKTINSNKPHEVFQPKVGLERLRVLDASGQDRFYIRNGKIVSVGFACGKSHSSNGIWKIICIILFLVLPLLYWKDDLHMYGNLFLKESTRFHSTLRKYYWDALQLNKKPLKKAELIMENKNIEAVVIDLIASDTNQKEPLNKVEVRKLVKDHFAKFKKIEKKKPKSHKNFIEEQCRIESKPKLADNFGTSENGFYGLASFGLSNITDYALKSEGARIVSVFDTEPYGEVAMKFFEYDFGVIHDFFIQKYFKSKGPSLILVPWKNPGDCWAFKGSRGRVQIELSQEIIITAVTIDHITKDRTLYGNLKSAPKKFSIIGVEDDGSQTQSKIHLGTYEYKISGPSTQIFTIEPREDSFFRKIDFVIESNHGNKEYTCIYKIGIHGHK